MAYSKTLTSAPQYRTMHRTASGRVYYTDRSSSYSPKDTIKWKGKHSPKGTTWSPTQQMINEFRSYGRDFVQRKYKLTAGRLNYLAKAINTAIQGKSSPLARNGFVAAAGRLTDGGPAEVANAAAGFVRKLNLNLENDEDRAHGQHHDWAQTTSISSLINSQLRQAQNAPADYFDIWAQTKSGKTEILKRDSSSFGIDASFTPDNTSSFDQADQEVSPLGMRTMQAESDPMGAFSTDMVMDPFYAQQEDDYAYNPDSDRGLAPGQGSDGLQNPWGFGYGGAMNAYGPSSQSMAAATMEAMALANAYFAPQRMELAYQLGDMETDMRRLAVNLGRQVDDPVLQAKLYKEGMRAVRTLDVQQNTMAFQMAEQRRREELANFQFYDQLAQEEYKMRLADQQFIDRMELDNAYFGLQRAQLDMAVDAANPPTPNTSPVPGTENSPVGGQQPAPTTTAPKPTTSPTVGGTGGGNLLDGFTYYLKG